MAARVVVHINPREIDLPVAVAPDAITHRDLASFYSRIPSIPAAITIAVPVKATGRRTYWAAVVNRSVLPATPSALPATPEDIEGIAFRTAVRIFNPYYGGASLTGISYECLPPAAIDAGKAKVYRVAREHTATFEAAPLGRVAVDVS
jgi:hypothetical protein